MDSKEIHAILERYWEGESSLAEEVQLREFFNQESVPEEFVSFKPLFQFFKHEQEAYLDTDFESKLSSKLTVVDNIKPRAHSLTFYIKRAAAVAAILIGVVFFFNKTGVMNTANEIAANELNKQERQEAQMAYSEAKAALLLISKKLKKGTSKAEKGISQVRKATRVIR